MEAAMHDAWAPHERGPTDRGGGGGGNMNRAGSGNMNRAGSGNMTRAGSGNMNRAGSGNMHRAGSGSGRGAGGGTRYRAGSAPRASVLGLPSRASGLPTQGSGLDGNQGAQATAYEPNCMLHLVSKGTASDHRRGSTCQ
jgi:hypothetical protein